MLRVYNTVTDVDYKYKVKTTSLKINLKNCLLFTLADGKFGKVRPL